MNPKVHTSENPRGLTLLEVMIAAVIFAITMTAIFMAFRTGTRAWQAGHGGSELFQAARIAQDVITRDMNNLFFRTETEYNLAFFERLRQAAAYDQSRSMAEGLPPDQRDSMLQALGRPMTDVSDFPPPVDLGLRGTDGGEFDSITFVRSKDARPGQAVASLGLRRIRYYVSDGTLMREEGSAYGFKPGDNFTSYIENSPSVEFVANQFIRTEASAEDPHADVGYSQAELPDSAMLTEPLCEGVTLFNITYGYYRSNVWSEVERWDSNAHEYRFPGELVDPFGIQNGPMGAVVPNAPINLENPGALGNPGASIALPGQEGGQFGSRRMVIVRGQPMSYVSRPDDLPGYMAIQLGLKNKEGKGGRAHYFTFYFSFPSAQEEFDTEQIDEDQRLGTVPVGQVGGAPLGR